MWVFLTWIKRTGEHTIGHSRARPYALPPAAGRCLGGWAQGFDLGFRGRGRLGTRLGRTAEATSRRLRNGLGSHSRRQTEVSRYPLGSQGCGSWHRAFGKDRARRELRGGVVGGRGPTAIAIEDMQADLGHLQHPRTPVGGDIGARTTESQVHRELASGLSAPIGFKNGTDGNIKIATDAIQAAARGHHFLSVHKNGQVAIVQTQGNQDCHVILRGGKAPNYDAASVAAACKELEAAKLPATLMVDCSHANSSKQHERQLVVAKDIADQMAGGSHSVFGVMIESHLKAGAQKFTPGKDKVEALTYGQSITDACMAWDDSLQALEALSAGVKARRGKK